MPKSTKRFILSTEAVNAHGFRVITPGIDLTGFIANPIMYWLHQYPNDEKAPERLPIGFWTDIQVNGTVLSAVPDFDGSDEFDMTIYNKVEHGTIRAASVGINPIELSSDPADMVAGQTLPTYKRSSLAEASIVDRGSNPEAVTLRISGDTLILLKQMADNAKTQTASNSNLSAFEDDHTPQTLALVQNAIKVKKITHDYASKMLSLGTDKASVDTIKHTIQKMPIDPDKLQGHYHPALLDHATKSYDHLKNKMPAGALNDMRDYAPDLYRAKFFEGNGKMPYEIDGKPC